MKTLIHSVVAAVALSVLMLGLPAMAQQPNKSVEAKGESKKDAHTACMDMMQGFMQSPKAPQAMNNMMEMARRMGNGDPMLGMAKMMEMMGGQGGMMGSGSTGRGGMMGDRSRGTK